MLVRSGHFSYVNFCMVTKNILYLFTVHSFIINITSKLFTPKCFIIVIPFKIHADSTIVFTSVSLAI